MTSVQYKRFYDEDPDLSRAVNLLIDFPEELQDIIAEGISEMADRHCQVQELMKDLRSLGPDKIMGIHKSKRKQRDSDKNPRVHKTLNYLFILPIEERKKLAREVLNLYQQVFEYMQLSKEYGYAPRMEDVENITQVYIYHGAGEVQEFLKKLKSEFKSKLIPRESITQEVGRNLQLRKANS
ncbi:MAG: hypothetical protein KTR14_01635 [Vampirovibrio sp.]|nr:hypothetical protein [Vampirovibrio sp.]